MAIQNNAPSGDTNDPPDMSSKAEQLRKRIEARRAQQAQAQQDAGGSPPPVSGGRAGSGGAAPSQPRPPSTPSGSVQGVGGVQPGGLRKPPAGAQLQQQVQQPVQSSAVGSASVPGAPGVAGATSQVTGQPVSIAQQNAGNPGAPQPGEADQVGSQGQAGAKDLNARKKGLFAKGKQVKAQLDSIDPTTAQYLAIFFNNLLYSLFMSPLKTVSSVFTTYIVFEAKNRILNLLVTFGLVLAVPMFVLAIWEYNWVLLSYPVGVILAFDLLYVQSFWGGDSSIEQIDKIIAETTMSDENLKGFAESDAGVEAVSGADNGGLQKGSLSGVKYATADQLQELTTPGVESSVEDLDDDYLL